MLSGLNARQKVDLMLNNNQQLDEKVDAMILDDPVVKSIVEEVKPDLILLDEMFILPSILHGTTPWVLICSMQPTMLYASKNLPPPWSGWFIKSISYKYCSHLSIFFSRSSNQRPNSMGRV